MKVNIQIEDATPEEAALVLSGISVANAMGRAAATIVRKKAETRIGYDGDCPNCGRTDSCHMDPMPGCFRPKGASTSKPTDGLPVKTPPTPKTEAKTVPDKKLSQGKSGKIQPKDSVKTGRRKGNKYGIPTELAKTDKKLFDRLWQRCKSHGIMYEQALVLKPAKTGRKPKAAGTSKQLREAFDPSNEWTLAEDAAIRECPNEDMALTHFMNKFPESERTAVEVSQRWQELRGLTDEMAGAET